MASGWLLSGALQKYQTVASDVVCLRFLFKKKKKNLLHVSPSAISSCSWHSSSACHCLFCCPRRRKVKDESRRLCDYRTRKIAKAAKRSVVNLSFERAYIFDRGSQLRLCAPLSIWHLSSFGLHRDPILSSHTDPGSYSSRWWTLKVLVCKLTHLRRAMPAKQPVRSLAAKIPFWWRAEWCSALWASFWPDCRTGPPDSPTTV